MEPQSSQRNIFLPISIIVAGVLVAGGLIYNAGVRRLDTGTGAATQPTASLVDAMKPISDQDHMRGDRNALVKMVTFEDPECPFCKQFHPTLLRILKEYDGKVAWVYRHFPLDAIHSQARQEIKGIECANKLGGANLFWAYLDKIFEITPSNNRLDLALLPKIAKDLGLDKAQFETCLAGTEFDKLIQDNLDDAVAAGGEGTPYTIILTKAGKKIPVSGALPYAQFKTYIDQALQ